MSNPNTRHARLSTPKGNPGPYLCRQATSNALGRSTKPGETVNCPECRVVLNALRRRYPATVLAWPEWMRQEEQDRYRDCRE